VVSSLATITGPITGPAARDAARTELRHTEYHRDDPSVVSRALDWLGRRLDSVVSGTPTGSATLILLILLVGLIVFAVLRAGRPQRLAQRRALGLDPLAPDERIDHRGLAAEHERAGRLDEALREWLRATITTIEARGLLDPRPGRTGAAMALEAGAVFPAIASELAASVAAFDQVWFGRRPAVAADVEIAHRVADAARTARVAESARAR
jgi:Domain of unknown function (DUF4129)